MSSQTKLHICLALKSGTVYESYLDTSRGLVFIASRIKGSFPGIFTVVADSRQQGNPYACALRGASVYCRADDDGTGAAPITGLPAKPVDAPSAQVHSAILQTGDLLADATLAASVASRLKSARSSLNSKPSATIAGQISGLTSPIRGLESCSQAMERTGAVDVMMRRGTIRGTNKHACKVHQLRRLMQ
jgi:hypothetical protein